MYHEIIKIVWVFQANVSFNCKERKLRKRENLYSGVINAQWMLLRSDKASFVVNNLNTFEILTTCTKF